MSSEQRPQRTRWYHHVIIVAIAVATSLFFALVRPSDETQRNIFVVAVSSLVMMFTARWIEKRRSPPRPPKGS